ncbi:hypothetical protein ABPG77_003262 [Micractinium sp. CCAP 211/92]
MECLQAEELSEAAAYSQLIPALMAIADRFEELYASASSSTDLVQLLRSLVPLSKPLLNLTECCAGSLSESPQEGHLACMISAALHCVNRARKPQYAAALQQLRSCVPLYLAILVPSLRQLPLPGEAGSSVKAWYPVLELLGTLIGKPELSDAAQLALTSGPSDNPLGQQLVTRLLPFLRSMTDSMALQQPTTDASCQGDPSTEHGAKPEQFLLSCFTAAVLMVAQLPVHAQAAMAAGPAWLQVLQALVCLLGRLQQQQQQQQRRQQQQQHQQQQQVGASCAAEAVYFLLVPALELLDFTVQCQCRLLLACNTAVPAGQQPPPQQLEQRCLAVSLAAWQAAEAVPAISALLVAPGLGYRQPSLLSLVVFASRS